MSSRIISQTHYVKNEKTCKFFICLNNISKMYLKHFSCNINNPFLLTKAYFLSAYYTIFILNCTQKPSVEKVGAMDFILHWIFHFNYSYLAGQAGILGMGFGWCSWYLSCSCIWTTWATSSMRRHRDKDPHLPERNF